MLFDADGEGTISVATFRVSTEHNIFQKSVKGRIVMKAKLKRNYTFRKKMICRNDVGDKVLMGALLMPSI